MTVESGSPAVARSTRTRWRVMGVIGVAALIAGLVYGGTSGFCYRAGNDTTAPPAPPASEPSIGGIALFSTWPKGVKPEAVLVLSGQTFGFVQPCGCSRPQMGGLERRANFIKG